MLTAGTPLEPLVPAFAGDNPGGLGNQQPSHFSDAVRKVGRFRDYRKRRKAASRVGLQGNGSSKRMEA